LLVLKFGGSSVGDADRIRNVASIIAGKAGEAASEEDRPAVVVSALAGVTDLLQAAAEAAARNDLPAQEAAIDQVERKHRWAASGCVQDGGDRHNLEMALADRFEEIRLLLRSIRTLGELSPRALDAVLACGELLSSRLLTAILVSLGTPARWLDPRTLMTTDDLHGEASPDLGRLRETVGDLLLPALRNGEVPVTGGFVGRGPSRSVTTLGRGGGDTAAAAVAAAAGAKELQIWTDVDGLMTADPRLVPEAIPLSSVGMAEASEMAVFGAKVLHPASLAPAVAAGVPVRVLNSLRPDRAGTWIRERASPEGTGLTSIASRSRMRLVRLEANRAEPGRKFQEKVSGLLQARPWKIDLLAQTEVGVSAIFRDEEEAREFLERSETVAEGVLHEDLALVAAVGENLRGDRLLRGRVAAELAAGGFVLLLAGGSPISLCALVHQDDLETTVRSLHDTFFVAGSLRQEESER